MTRVLDRFITALRNNEHVPPSWADDLPWTDLNARGPADHTPLGSATFHGRHNLACRLLERGAGPDVLYANGRTPLMGAVHQKDVRMARLLLDAGADPDLGLPAGGYAPLHRAARSGLLELAALLLDRGADVNATVTTPQPEFGAQGESGGETPLHYAAASARESLCALLVRRGGERWPRNAAGLTPLDWANRSKRPAAFVRWFEELLEEAQSPGVPRACKIYERLGLRRLINARCILGRYGDCVPSVEVLDVMRDAAGSYVWMRDLHNAVCRQIAEITGNEAAHVCASASAGGLLAIAGCMSGPDGDRQRDEVVMHSKGRWPEHKAIFPSGCRIVEVDGETHAEVQRSLEAAINDRTAAIFLASSDRTSAIPIPLAVDLGEAHGLPVVVDGAYSLPPKENLWHFTRELGVDLAVFSGGKGLCAPASTGLIVGREQWVRAAQRHAREHGGALGFSAKVGKDEMVGLLVAIEVLLQRDEEAVMERYRTRIRRLREVLQRYAGLSFKAQFHGKWADNAGLGVYFDQAEMGIAPSAVQEACQEGAPSIAISANDNAGRGDPAGIFVNVATLLPGEEQIVADRLAAIFAAVTTGGTSTCPERPDAGHGTTGRS